MKSEKVMDQQEIETSRNAAAVEIAHTAALQDDLEETRRVLRQRQYEQEINTSRQHEDKLRAKAAAFVQEFAAEFKRAGFGIFEPTYSKWGGYLDLGTWRKKFGDGRTFRIELVEERVSVSSWRTATTGNLKLVAEIRNRTTRYGVSADSVKKVLLRANEYITGVKVQLAERDKTTDAAELTARRIVSAVLTMFPNHTQVDSVWSIKPGTFALNRMSVFATKVEIDIEGKRCVMTVSNSDIKVSSIEVKTNLNIQQGLELLKSIGLVA